jgi:integrase
MGKRGNGEGSIYQRSDGRWVGAVNLGYADGKRKRKVVYGQTRRSVADQLKLLLRDQQQGLNIAPQRQTVEQFLRQWLSGVTDSVRPKTACVYRWAVEQHIIPAIGCYQLQQLTAQQVDSLKTKLTAQLKPTSVVSVLLVLRVALNQAVEWELVRRNVASLVPQPRIVQRDTRIFTPDEARSFLDACKHHRLEALYTVALALGLRKGEALGLQWSDVDLDAGMLRIRHTLQRARGNAGELVLVEPKTTSSRRTIALPEMAVKALRLHRMRQLEEKLNAGPRWQEHGLVFTSRHGTPIDPTTSTRDFLNLLAKARIPRMRFHDLRHSCASLLLAQNVHPKVVQELLGHANIQITLNRYSHVLPATKSAAAATMDDLFPAAG